MQLCISSLTAIALLIHAALGCCWHHAHSCIGCENSAARASAEPVACCEHCQDRHRDQSLDHGQPDPSPQSPCKCRLECNSVCAYLPTPKTQIEAPQIVAPFDVAMCIPAQSLGQISPTRCEQAGGSADLPPPLRLHLLHQILLI